MPVIHGDAVAVLRTLSDNSVDAILTDPPYGLSNTDPAHVAEAVKQWVTGNREYLPPVKGGGFMGKEWDAFVPPIAVWDECLRVLKPGGYLLSFAGSRTMDLMTLAIRLAGFDIRDSIAWLYGSGFPKSMDLSKAIDKAAGAEREVIGTGSAGAGFNKVKGFGVTTTKPGEATTSWDVTTGATPEAQQWEGWGTALKPAFEPIIMARKPLEQKTVAANVLKWGTGAVNIDSSRIGSGTGEEKTYTVNNVTGNSYGSDNGKERLTVTTVDKGRFPANVILDESQAAALDEQSGTLTSGSGNVKRSSSASRNGNAGPAYGAESRPDGTEMISYGDSGGASRFFYCAKAPKSERPVVDGVAHATVKPLALMRYLVKLVTPPNGTVLEPFAGSGTTVEAALMEGFQYIAIEREAEYLPLIQARIDRAVEGMDLL